MPAPVWQSSTTSFTTTGTNQVFTKPGSVVAGDLLIATFQCNGTINGVPTGWTLIDGTSQQYAYWKIAGGSEPASYTWTTSASSQSTGAISRITGHDPVNPINVTGTTVTGTTATATATSITTTKSNCLLFLAASVFGSTITMTHSPMTERFEVSNATTNRTVGGATEIIAAPGATGTRSVTLSASPSPNSWRTHMFAIAPAFKAVLTEGSSTTDATSYATASITPTANTLILLAVSNGVTTGATAGPSSVTGNGLTWTEVASQQNQNHRTTLFKAYGASPSAGAVTINFAATQHNCVWKIAEFSGESKVIQSNTASGTNSPATVTLSNAVTGGNPTFGVMSQNSTTGAITIDSDFEEVGTQQSAATPSNKQAAQWDVDGENPISFATGSVEWAIIGAELGTFVTYNATASFAGTGSFASAAPIWTAAGGASFSGTGSFAATGVRTQFATASFSGVGSFAATGVRQQPAVASFSGVGDFSAAGIAYNQYDPPEVSVYIETTADVWVACDEFRSGTVTRGRQKELDKFNTGECTLEFNNEDRTYDPVYAGSPLNGYLKPKSRMKVEAFQNGVTYPIFFGYIERIDNQRIQPKQNIATIKLSDMFKVLNKATMNGTDLSVQFPGERIEEILDRIPIDASLRDIDTGTVLLQDMTDVASTLLAHVQMVETTEFGALYVQADGVIRFKDQDTLREEPQHATFGEDEAELHYRSITSQYDDSLIRNPVSVDRVGGTMQTVEDTDLSAPPPDGYGDNHHTVSGTYHFTDDDALVAAELILSQYREPKRRINGMTIGPVEFEQGPDVYPQILGRELTEGIIVIERPQGVGERIQQKSIIEGIRHTFSPKKWTTTWNLSPSFVADATFSGTSEFTAVAGPSPDWQSVRTNGHTSTGALPESLQSLTITKPSGTVAGDLLVAFITVGTEGTIVKPDGWTQIRSTDFGPSSVAGFRSYYKVAGSSEPADYTWENTDLSNTYIYGVVNRITGADPVNPINVSSQLKHSSGTDATGESVTTTVDNCLLIMGCALYDTAAVITPPAGMTERWDFTATSGSLKGFEGSTVTLGSAGATGDKVTSHTNADNAAHLIAIAPA